MSVNADYIVTRNIADFSASPIPAILPEELLQKMVVQDNRQEAGTAA